MVPDLDPTVVDAFVIGHTHLPSLAEVERPEGRRAVMVNSGCFLRQLQPVSPRLKGPSLFVSKFVLSHVRVFAQDGQLCAELWEQPKPARPRLTRIVRPFPGDAGRLNRQKTRSPASWGPPVCSHAGVFAAGDPGKVEASPPRRNNLS